jgi:penicillin-binding protein 1B
MNETARRVYSTRRLRIVVALLTLIFLPIVVGASLLIYQYMVFSVMVEQRLKGEEGRLPSRVYARPLVLRPGMVVTPDGLVRRLNGLRYGEREAPLAEAGQFARSDAGVTFFPRPVEGGATEPITVTFVVDKQGVTRIRDLRGSSPRRRYAEQALEPELVTYMYDQDREKRRRVTFEEMPDHLVKAVLAIEDRRFFSHPGVDPLALMARAFRNLRSDSSIPYGGSTVTQQLCKNFFLTQVDERGYRFAERTYRRKAQEALLAFVLERRASKQEILELYLNGVYLGQSGSFGIYGVGEAARIYFRKDVSNLTLPESALLAGMIQSPNPYNPFRHEERAIERRNEVIRAMQDAGYIDKAAMEEALKAPLLVERPRVDTADAPYFVDLVREQLGKRYDPKDLVTQNLSIYTTLDLQLQELAQKALERGLDHVQELIRKRTAKPVEGCLIALEPASGKVVALVGGRSYGRSQYNRVMEARRQPGSTFKPFVYLTAFEATFDDPSLPPITPATVVEDEPAVFFFEDKEYIPTNYEDEYHGMVTLRRALAMSMNVATVKVAEMVGYDRVADLWSKKLRIGAPIEPYPAVALGSFEATPYEMATAYNVIANGGLEVEPVTLLRVTDENGRVIEQPRAPVPERAVHEESAFLITDMLRSVIDEGTAASARALGFTAPAAGKTGTTNDYRDAWFDGFTPDLLCVVWVGFDDNTPVGLSGTRAALPIWVDFMKAALGGGQPTPFPPPPEGIVFVDIDRDTGLLATPACPRVRSEAFIAGTEPREPCNAH